ncbi:hypothetical protein ACIBG5_42165 [Kribbella sp. NPDC050241]|uniref:hypothetical protein n=1 Tax=Kribbella sp. NPDC050241 TaxID=3364115 RepID=UPI00378C5745
MILAAMAIGLPVAVGLAVGWPVEGVVAAAGALVGTGMVVAMLLAAVRTPLIAILDDYYLAVRTMNTRAARMGETALSSAVLERYCARARAEMMAFLDSPEVAAFRSSAPVDRLRERMTGPAVS